MKKLLILFGIILSIGLSAQIPGNPDASGVITPGPPDYVTGAVPGDGELKLQLGYLNSRTDSLTSFIDPSDSTATFTTIDVDSAALGAVTYTNTYWEDLRVPLTNTRINPANSEPDFEDAGDGTFAWGFDADSDSAWTLNFVAQIPHSYKEGTDICAHIHWQPDGTNTGDVVWKLAYTTASIDSAFSTVDTLRVLDAGSGVALQHQFIDFGDIDGTNLLISAIIKGSIARMGDAPDDDFTGTAYGLELDFHFQLDSPGSKEKLIKY